MRKHELLLESAIVGMVNALAFLDGVALSEPVKVNFDDSIIEDSRAELDNAIAKLTNGLMSHRTVMVEVLGMTEEEAEAELNRIKDESSVSLPAIDFLHSGREEEQQEAQEQPEQPKGEEKEQENGEV